MNSKHIQESPRDRDRDEQTTDHTKDESRRFSKQAVHLENIFHSIPEGVIVTDRQGCIHDMNPAARALLGEPDGGLMLDDWRRAFGLCTADGTGPFPAEELPPTRALQGSKNIPTDEMILRRRANSKQHLISMSAEAILANNGVIEGVTTLLGDITHGQSTEPLHRKQAHHRAGLYEFSNLLAESANDVNRIASSVAALTSEIIGDLSAVVLLKPGTTKLSVVAFHDTDPAASPWRTTISYFRKMSDWHSSGFFSSR